MENAAWHQLFYSSNWALAAGEDSNRALCFQGVLAKCGHIKQRGQWQYLKADKQMMSRGLRVIPERFRAKLKRKMPISLAKRIRILNKVTMGCLNSSLV